MGQVLLLTTELVDIVAFTVAVIAVLVCGQRPDASRLFAMWVFMGVLHSKLFSFPEALRKSMSAWSSVTRCATFFEATTLFPSTPSLELSKATSLPGQPEGLFVVDGDFFFEQHCTEFCFGQSAVLLPVLEHVNVLFQRGHLHAVVGSVGFGKTSLLLGLLGELHTSAQTRMSRDAGGPGFAYVPQDPVIFNCTVRENITFGRSFDEALYQAVCTACIVASGCIYFSGW
ncbi:unnamed protein product [Prorocentrum cordatum]|uniref:ABC transporter domain-containing protein n=1 Tax=Prorocentrum cordatum TaxID=2364126 RepID=A0ABN9UDY2_9DINO|nr:unnamed protein product [Polarella glacialis]